MIRKLLAIIVLVMVTSLSVAGCTTPSTGPNSTTSPSNNATVSIPAPKSADLSAQLNNAFTSKNYTLVVPFTRAVNQYGNWVYSGVVKDGEDKLVPYVHNMTIEETKNRSETLTRFNAYISQAMTNGYKESYNSTSSWTGTIGNVSNPDRAYVRIAEPNGSIYGYNTYTSISDANYTVLSEYSTKV